MKEHEEKLAKKLKRKRRRFPDDTGPPEEYLQPYDDGRDLYADPMNKQIEDNNEEDKVELPQWMHTLAEISFQRRFNAENFGHLLSKNRQFQDDSHTIIKEGTDLIREMFLYDHLEDTDMFERYQQITDIRNNQWRRGKYVIQGGTAMIDEGRGTTTGSSDGKRVRMTIPGQRYTGLFSGSNPRFHQDEYMPLYYYFKALMIVPRASDVQRTLVVSLVMAIASFIAPSESKSNTFYMVNLVAMGIMLLIRNLKDFRDMTTGKYIYVLLCNVS